MTEAYGRFPADAIENGLLIRIKGKSGALAVYNAIALHCNANYEAWPSVERLALLTGLTLPGTFKAIRDLIKAGAITKVHGGGRGHANVYRLLNSKRGFTVLAGETVNTGCVNSKHRLRKQSTPVYPNSKGTDQEQQQAAAGVDLPSPKPASPIRLALAEVGIGEPTQSELAQALADLPQDTAMKIIAAEKSQVRERGKGPGAIVLNIRAAIKREKDRQQGQANRKVNEERWNGLTESAKVAYRAKMLQDKPNLQGHPDLDGMCRANLDKLDAMSWPPDPTPPACPGGPVAPDQTPASGG